MDKQVISAHEKMMETMPKEFKRIMSQVEAAVRSEKQDTS